MGMCPLVGSSKLDAIGILGSYLNGNKKITKQNLEDAFDNCGLLGLDFARKCYKKWNKENPKNKIKL